MAERVYSTFEKAINWVEETLNIELLDESGETSAENRSSSVILLQLDGEKYLFTGDSGIESLKKVVEYAEENLIDISKVRFFQVPHHGSKRNVSPTVLNAIRCETAFISAAKDAPKHPAKKVTNALKRRNSKVYTTNGHTLSHHNNASRAGWYAAPEVPFYYQVEE